jgi:hypothetical protein
MFNPQILFYLGMSFLGFIAGFVPLWTGSNISLVIAMVVFIFGGAFMYTILINRDKEIALLLSTNILVFSVFLVMGTVIGQELRASTQRRLQQQSTMPTSRVSFSSSQSPISNPYGKSQSMEKNVKKDIPLLFTNKDSLFIKEKARKDSIKKAEANKDTTKALDTKKTKKQEGTKK